MPGDTHWAWQSSDGRMSWLYLSIAGAMEIGFAAGLKYSNGFTRFWPSAGTVTAGLASIYFLSLSLRTIPIGTGYAVWTGIGAAGTAILGVCLLGEGRSIARLVCIATIIAGVVGLRVLARE